MIREYPAPQLLVDVRSMEVDQRTLGFKKRVVAAFFFGAHKGKIKEMKEFFPVTHNYDAHTSRLHLTDNTHFSLFAI